MDPAAGAPGERAVPGGAEHPRAGRCRNAAGPSPLRVCAGEDRTLLRQIKARTPSHVERDSPGPAPAGSPGAPSAHGDIARRIGFYTAGRKYPRSQTFISSGKHRADRQAANTLKSCGSFGLPGQAPLPFPAEPLGSLCPGQADGDKASPCFRAVCPLKQPRLPSARKVFRS